MIRPRRDLRASASGTRCWRAASPHDALQELERAGESPALSGAERASALG